MENDLLLKEESRFPKISLRRFWVDFLIQLKALFLTPTLFFSSIGGSRQDQLFALWFGIISLTLATLFQQFYSTLFYLFLKGIAPEWLSLMDKYREMSDGVAFPILIYPVLAVLFSTVEAIGFSVAFQFFGQKYNFRRLLAQSACLNGSALISVINPLFFLSSLIQIIWFNVFEYKLLKSYSFSFWKISGIWTIKLIIQSFLLTVLGVMGLLVYYLATGKLY